MSMKAVPQGLACGAERAAPERESKRVRERERERERERVKE